jgi:UDP-N-acetylglucosamine/UDP-N-acetylgalactosamine 4-epimerase
MTKYEEVQERLRSRPRLWVVTGAAGFIGSHLVENLLKLEQRVAGLDNFSTGNRGNLTQVKSAVSEGQWRNFRFIEGDIRSPDICRRVCRAGDYVLHQAALDGAARSIEHPVGIHDINITGFLNMLVAARDAGVSRFVYAGSSSAYGDHPGLPRIEQDIGRPLSPYGASKYVNELYAEVFARCYGFDSVGLRYFNVFGPRQEPDGPHAAVIPKWIANMVRNEPVFINGDGETARDFCHVDDAVQANVLAATADEPAAFNQVYNIALGGRTTLIQLFGMLRDLLEPRYPHLRDLRPVHRAFRAADMRVSQADIGKAVRLLGYCPRWRVEEGLARTVGWYVARPVARRAVQEPRLGSRLVFPGRASATP